MAKVDKFNTERIEKLGMLIVLIKSKNTAKGSKFSTACFKGLQYIMCLVVNALVILNRNE